MPKIRILLVFSVAAGLCACVKPKEFPIEPYLEFRQNILYTIDDSVPALEVEFYFQDGDGDIGREKLSSGDYTRVYPYVGDSFFDLHFRLYEVSDDTTFLPVFLEDSSSGGTPIDYLYHLPYVEPVNANDAVSGTIRWEVDDFSGTAYFMRGCSICFGIYIYDRALHKSNTIYTDPIKL